MTLNVPTVDSWSFSGLLQFEKCPYGTKLGRIDRVPRPNYDEDPDHPLTRGSRIHGYAEDYIQGKVAPDPVPKDLRGFVEELRQYRAMFEEGRVLVEQPWAFDKDWGETDWFAKDCWCRVKCDVVVQWDPKNATIVDWKTGKKMGKEVAHTQQAQIYAIAAFLKYPDLERVDVVFAYTDEFQPGTGKENKRGKTTTKHYTRSAATAFLPKWTERGQRMTACINFQPKPNKANCTYCDYGHMTGTGDCIYAAGD